MAKRTKTQLTREQAYAGEEEPQSSDDEDTVSQPKQASEAVMARRRIAHFKGRRGGESAGGVNHTSNTDGTKAAKATQLKSLNANFLKAINDAVTKNPVANLQAIVGKYTEYYGKVEVGKINVKNPDIPKVEVKVTKEELAPATTAGPKFTVDKLPTSKDYGFKFGYVPPVEDDSDDEIKVEGPTFKLPAGLTKQDPNAAFKFPEKPKENQNLKPEGTSVPTFSFKPEAKVAKPAVTAAPVFSFKPEAKAETAATQLPAPTFSFKPKNSELVNENTTPVLATPATVASTTAATTTAAPTFPEAKPFSFGSTPSSSFKLATTSSSEKQEESAPFSFSSGKTAGFSFGTDSAKSAFSFGGSKSSDLDKTAGQTTKPTLSFGSTSNPFGNGSSTPSFGNAAANGASKPSFGFTFTPPKSVEKTETAEAEPEPEDTVKGNFAVVKLAEKVETKTGEEEEKAIYVKRTRISKYNPENKEKPYETVGVGELKVLVNDSTKRSRILVRSDGNGNVLLNVLILKDAKYALAGAKKNMLRIPSLNATGKMDIFLAQVKTGDDGKELLEKVESCQA
ncbi:DEKNAAC101839 [Brettanomyces naardenensis]|uniref:DEKNAAC101839 n=1 Tax=Brettanomyces naardenensis TaxID=13370 RepID=A0A448YJC1_BRENA|nr:DEKNAAC101839 [Brettanomyces naardenensis]